MKWSDIESSYSFITASDELKEKVRNRFWNEEVKPSVIFQQYNDIGEAPSLYEGIFKKQYKYDGNDPDIKILTPEQMKRINMAWGYEASGTTPEKRKQIQERMSDVHYQESRKWMQEISDEWTLGQITTDMGYLQGISLWERDLTQEEQQELESLKKQAERLSVDVSGRNIGTKALYSFSNIIPLMSRSVIEGFKTGVAGAATGAAVGSIVPGVGTLIGAGKGYLYGQILGSSKFMAYVEGGGAYDEMKEIGISDETAKPLAMGVGVVNAAIEMAQWATIAKTIPGASALIKNGVKLTGKAIAKEALEKGTKKGLAAELIKIGGRMAITGTEEIAQETLQENVTLWSAEIGKHIENKATNAGLDPISSAEYWNRMKDVIEGSLGMYLMGFFGGSVSVGKAINEYSRENKILSENEKYTEDGVSPEEALQAVEVEDQPETLVNVKSQKQDNVSTKAKELSETVNAEGFGKSSASISEAIGQYKAIQDLSVELDGLDGLEEIQDQLYEVMNDIKSKIDEAQKINAEKRKVILGENADKTVKETTAKEEKVAEDVVDEQQVEGKKKPEPATPDVIPEAIPDVAKTEQDTDQVIDQDGEDNYLTQVEQETNVFKLRKLAKERGVELPRNAKADEIKQAIYDDAGVDRGTESGTVEGQPRLDTKEEKVSNIGEQEEVVEAPPAGTENAELVEEEVAKQEPETGSKVRQEDETDLKTEPEVTPEAKETSVKKEVDKGKEEQVRVRDTEKGGVEAEEKVEKNVIVLTDEKMKTMTYKDISKIAKEKKGEAYTSKNPLIIKDNNNNTFAVVWTEWSNVYKKPYTHIAKNIISSRALDGTNEEYAVIFSHERESKESKFVDATPIEVIIDKSNADRYGIDIEKLSKTPTPLREASEKVEKKVNKKYSYTSKSEKGQPQRAVLSGNTIVVINKTGRETVGKYTVTLKEWENAKTNPTFNENFNYNKLITDKFKKAFPTAFDEYGGEKIPFYERIIDSQISAIKNVYNQYINDNKQSKPDTKYRTRKLRLTPDTTFGNQIPDKGAVKTKQDIAEYNAKAEILNALYDAGILSEDLLYEIEDEYTLLKYGEKRTFEEIVDEKLLDLEEENITASNAVDYIEEINVPKNITIEELARLAKGTTSDLKEAGYILSNGDLLDFSGKRKGGGLGERAEDHRQLEIPFKESLSGTDAMFAFMNTTGAIRMDVLSGILDITAMPTPEQFVQIKKVLNKNKGESYVELYDGKRYLLVDGKPIDFTLRRIKDFYTNKKIGSDRYYRNLTEQGRDKVKKEYAKLPLQERKKVKAEITKILDKILGKGNYNLNLVNEIARNPNAVGAQYDNVIEILNGIPDSRNTALHEAVHYIMRNTLSREQRNEIFSLLRDQFGKDMTNAELEEILAEGLIEYVNATEQQKAQMNFSDRVKAWFDKIIDTMKKLFTNEDSVWNSVNDFYADLYAGKLQDTQASPFKADAKSREINQQAKNIKEVRDKDGDLIAPNGKKSNLNELQWKQVRTKAFKAWFGDWEKHPDKASKVVDENGEPMVVYHGTRGGFTVFSEDKAGTGALAKMKNNIFSEAWRTRAGGFFFTSIRDEAQEYSNFYAKGEVYGAFLNIRDDITFNITEYLAESESDGIKAMLEEQGYSDDEIEDIEYDGELHKYVQAYLDYSVIDPYLKLDTEFNIQIQEAKRGESDGVIADFGGLTYDGEIFDEDTDDYKKNKYGNIYIAITPTQIKSATANIGTFSPTDPDIRYREVKDKMTPKQNKMLHALAGQYWNDGEVHNHLSKLAKEVTGVTSMKELTSDQFQQIKAALEKKIEQAQKQVDEFTEYIEIRRKDRRRAAKIHAYNMTPHSTDSGEGKAQPKIVDNNRDTVLEENKKWVQNESAKFEKKLKQDEKISPKIKQWLIKNIGSPDIMIRAKEFEYYQEMVKFLTNYEKQLTSLTKEQVTAIKMYLQSSSSIIPKALEKNIDLQAMLVSIDRFKELDAKKKKHRLNTYDKIWLDFGSLMGAIAEKSGNIRLLEVAKKVIDGRIKYKEVFDIDITGFSKNHDATISKLTIPQTDKILVYMNTGNLAEEFKDNEAIMSLIKDIDIIRERDKKMITVARILQAFKGRLWNGVDKNTGAVRKDFTDSQWKFIQKAIAEHGSDYLKNNQAWKDWINDVREFKVEGARDFIKENYLMGSKDELSQNDIKLLEEESLYDPKSDSVDIGVAHLKTRKVERGGKYVDPFNQLFYAHRMALKAEYLSEAPNELNSILKDTLVDTDYELVKKQLKRIMEIGTAKSDFAKAVELAMSRLYLGVVVSGGKPQFKNFFQFFLTVQNLSQLGDAAKIMASFKDVSKLIESKHGKELVERIRSEFSQRHGINRLSTSSVNGFINELKSKEAWKEGSKGAYLITKFFTNPVFEAWNNTWGANALKFQQYLDMRNRMASFLLVSNQAEKTFSKKNVTWNQIRNELALTNMNKADQLYLSKIYANQGASEFVYQLAKIKTEQSQFQYDTALKSLMVSTGDTFLKQAFQYSTWWLSYQRRVFADIKAAFRKGDRRAALRALSFGAVTGAFVKVLIEIVTNTLPGDDDDDYMNRIKASALGFFDPRDWTGSWNASTMIPLVSPFKIKGILSGDPYSELQAGDFVSGQFGDLALSMANGVVGLFQLTMGGEEMREAAGRRLAYNFESIGRQTFFPYILAERAWSLFTGSKRVNINRKLLDAFGIVDYNPKEIERDWLDIMQYTIFGVNPRDLGKDKRVKKFVKPAAKRPRISRK